MPSIFKKAICFGWLLALLSTIIWVAPVHAQGGFAMSGSFYAQKLELPQGTVLNTPDIYIVVFNNYDEDINVKLSTNVPMGVSLILSEHDFVLTAHSQKKMQVGIEVGMDAIPGDYQIGIVAEPYKEGVQGIQIVGGAGQEADLTVTGESGSVDIATITPDGASVPAMIILLRDYEDHDFEIARTETGSLLTNVSPGSYIARAFISGNQLAEESFVVATDEQKNISLTVKTVYFEGFEIVPVNQRDTGNLVMVEAVSTVNNLAEAFTNVKVNLLINSDTQQETRTIINLSRMEKGRVELNYNYVPTDEWRQGVYIFKLELEIGGEIYTTSQAKILTVDETGKVSLNGIGGITDGESSTPTPPADTEADSQSTFPWLIVVGVVVGVLIVITIIVLARKRTK